MKMQLTFWRITLELVCFVLSGVLSQSTNNEHRRNYLQSMSDTRDLLELNRELASNLNIYATQLQQKSDILKRLAKEWQKNLQVAEDNESEYLSNPLNFYSFIRHMHADWPRLHTFIEQPVGPVPVDFIKQSFAELPIYEDVQDVNYAIDRMLTVYDLKPADIAKGLLDGVQYNTTLSPLDCYEMGKYSFEAHEYDMATAWLNTAQNLLDDKSQSDLYELLGVSSTNISILQSTLSAQAEEQLPNLEAEFEPEYFFKQLCRNSFTPKRTNLHCFYKTTSAHYLRLAPVKTEVLSLDPYVAVFHNVIYESEIAEVKQMSEALLSPAKIKLDDNTPHLSKKRLVNGAWLVSSNISMKQLNVINQIRQRVKDMTEMRLNSIIQSEMQFLEYGFGGYYGPHWDFLNVTTIPMFRDDRIATILFYLNDVPNGGRTAFPELELSVRPELGKALLWYNMLPGSFDYDDRSLHVACPILHSAKLALTLWIPENAQMFTRPCLQPPKYRTYNYD